MLDSRAYWGCDEPWLTCVVSVELDSLEVKDDWDVCEPTDNDEILLSYCNIDNNMQYRKSKTIHFLGILIGRKINYLKIKQGYRNIMDN